jgi:hypothetical protein
MIDRWVMDLVKNGSARGPPRLVRTLAVETIVVAGVLAPIGAQAAAPIATALTLAAPSTGTYRTAISPTGYLSKAGTTTKIANGQVTLQRAPNSKATWKSQNSVLTTRPAVTRSR